MRSIGGGRSFQKLVEGESMDIGNILSRRVSSTDRLLAHLLKAECVLRKIQQGPPQSTCRAIFPIMKALIIDDILKHTDVDVQVLVASCFDELCRITAPKPPYPDDQMKLFFRLLMVAFQQLSNKSDTHCDRALKIIGTMATVKSTWLLLDIDTEGVIVEIFRIFLNSIRSNHSDDVFKHMETIMSMVIMESNKISFQLLKPLLDSVKKKNKNASPVSFALGEKVLQNCVTKVQPYLKEATKGMNLDFDDYTGAVTSMLSDALNAKDMMSKEVVQISSDEDETELVGKRSLGKRKRLQKMGKLGMKPSAPQRKTNLTINSEEGYQRTRSSKGKDSVEVSPGHHRQTKRDFASSSKARGKTKEAYSSDENDCRKIVRHGKRSRTICEQSDEDFPENIEIDRESNKVTEKDKKKMPKRRRIVYGEELVGETIQVWWPLDKTYYTGTIVDFYPLKNKHMILYEDDMIETLDLVEEEWKLISNEQLHRSKKARQNSRQTR